MGSPFLEPLGLFDRSQRGTRRLLMCPPSQRSSTEGWIQSVTNKVIAATDGLRDLYEGRLTATKDVIKCWAYVVMEEGDGFEGHKSLSLASDGLGEELNAKSMRLTIDLDQAWLDDTTIVVITI